MAANPGLDLKILIDVQSFYQVLSTNYSPGQYVPESHVEKQHIYRKLSDLSFFLRFHFHINNFSFDIIFSYLSSQ